MGGIADAVGHCVLIFAFVPVLAALPRWLSFEANNPFNLEDPIVLAFLPVRAAIVALNEFIVGFLPGILAGLINGGLVAAWVALRGRPATRGQEIGVGAACGVLGAGLMVIAGSAYEVSQGRPAPSRLDAVAFELASGTVCGMLAVSTAIRLLTAQRETSASASQ